MTCWLQVRMAVSKSLSVYLSLRQHRLTPRHNSAFSGDYITADNQQSQPVASPDETNSEKLWARLCCQGSQQSAPHTAAPE